MAAGAISVDIDSSPRHVTEALTEVVSAMADVRIVAVQEHEMVTRVRTGRFTSLEVVTMRVRPNSDGGCTLLMFSEYGYGSNWGNRPSLSRFLGALGEHVRLGDVQVLSRGEARRLGLSDRYWEWSRDTVTLLAAAPLGILIGLISSATGNAIRGAGSQELTSLGRAVPEYHFDWLRAVGYIAPLVIIVVVLVAYIVLATLRRSTPGVPGPAWQRAILGAVSADIAIVILVITVDMLVPSHAGGSGRWIGTAIGDAVIVGFGCLVVASTITVLRRKAFHPVMGAGVTIAVLLLLVASLPVVVDQVSRPDGGAGPTWSGTGFWTSSIKTTQESDFLSAASCTAIATCMAVGSGDTPFGFSTTSSSDGRATWATTSRRSLLWLDE